MAGFTAGSIFASLFVSGIGLVLTSYGKKLARPPQLVVGLVMLIYPYFVPRVVPMLIVAGVLLAAMWLAIRRGH
jgi:lipopolysaccharide export LptBFGC system permease protein LptF